MAIITSVDVRTPPDAVNLYDTNLRPTFYLYINGGTSTFQVVWEWDTVSTFDSGNLIAITDSALTGFGPHSKAPNADLGPAGTTWYFRATVTDSATDTDEVQSIYNDATGGTFDLDFDGQPATGLAWNISAVNLKAALEALSNITTVGVAGTGTSGDPWIVTFTNPGSQDVAEMTADDTNLTGHTTGTTITTTTPGDTNSVWVEPPSGTHTIVYQDVRDPADFLYLYSNVGVGFTADGADGDPKDMPRFLFNYGNVGVAFGPELPDGDPKDNPSFLYQYAELEPTQPCPWIDYIAPTLVKQGEALVITGDSFGAAQSTYTTEIRLYEDADLSGTYVTMSSTSWDDKEIVALVPAGASTGWVVVSHTNVDRTCDYSNSKKLQVTQREPDADAGWWLKTSDKQNVLGADHTVLPGNNVKTAFRKIMNSIGSGRVELPLGDPIINEFIDPVTRKGVLVRTYIDDMMRYGWFAETLSHDYDEEGNAVAVIAGRGMEVVALKNKIGPHDFPASPTRNPTWIYGSTDNFVSNPGFDDAVDNPILQNPGGEDGNDDDGNAEGWSKRGDNVVSYTSILSGDAMTDDWYIEVEASDNHSGVQQSVTVTPNRVYHVRCYVKDPLASGMRVTLALGGADDIEATASYPNNFEFGNEILAELDNVARNPASNGLPGGSTDGTWQVMDVEVKTGDEQTSLSISVQNDHHQTGVFNPFWIDSVEIEGWGLGLDPWRAFRPAQHASNSFRLQTAKTYDGSAYGLYLNPLERYAGVEQVIEVTPNTKYTASIWMWTDRLYADDTFKLVIRANDGLETWIADEDKVPNDEGWTQYQVIFTTGELIEEIILRFAYTGPNNPGPAYVDSVSLLPGEPPSTAGVILNNVLDKMAIAGKLLYLNRTFTDEYDSNGFAWPSALSLDIGPSESLYGLLGRLVALGHEWEIVPAAFNEGGDTGFELNVYKTRSYEADTGVGVNWTNNPEGPVIMPGDATIGGRILKSVFNVNTVMAIGDDGVWSRVNQHPWLDADMDVSDPAAHGYKDSFGEVEDIISVSASDAETISLFAQARLADEKSKERALQLLMQRSSVIRPFYSFGVGDSLFVDMPPTDSDPPVDNGSGGFSRSHPKRVRSLQADLAGEGSDMTFQVDIDRVIYEDELAWYATIAQLSERAPGENSGQGTGTTSGAGGTVSTVVAGGGTTAVEAHKHSLKSTEITDKATLGDVSGTLPGPITVNALKGRPVSNVIPAPSGPTLEVAMIFDPDTLVWTPKEIDTVSSDLTTKGDLHGFSTDDDRVPVGADGSFLRADSAQDTGVAWEEIMYSVPFSQPGALGPGVGTSRLYTATDRTIVDVTIMVGGASTSGVVTVDVNMDGTTIFTTTANRPEIAALVFVSPAEIPDVTAWDADSYLTVDVDAEGTAATDLVVVVRYQEA